MKVLKDVAVTFDPKDRPSDLLRFWNADIHFESDLFDKSKPLINEYGEIVIKLEMRVKADETKPWDVAFGVLGQWPL